MAPKRGHARNRLRIAALAAVFMTSLDISIVNVAVPTLAREMHADLPPLQWVLDGYISAFAALLLASARLGRSVGGPRLLRIGIAAFTLVSLACSAAPSIGLLIAARVLQGIAASLVLPSALAVTTRLAGKERLGREIGLFSSALGAATALGPGLGALLIAQTSWRAIFWINVPIGVATWLLARRGALGEPQVARDRGPRPADVLPSAAGLFAVSYGLIEAGRHGWGDGRPLATIAAGMVMLAAFGGIQRGRGADALVNLRLLARAPIWLGNGAALMTFSAMMGATFIAPLVMVGLYGYPLPRMAAVLSCTSLLVLVLAPISGRGVERFGPVPLLAVGSAIEAGALWSFGALGLTPSFGLVAVAAAALGAGFGLALPPLTVMAMGGTTGEEAHDASGLFSTFRQVGLAVGVAAFGSLASTTVAANLRDLGGPAAGLSIADLAVRGISYAPGAEPIRLAVWNGVATTFHFTALTALAAAIPAFALVLRRRALPPLARVEAGR